MNICIKESEQKSLACIIWMHGLGSDANNMLHLANQLPLSLPVRHVCVDAPVRPITINNNMPLRAWYDIVGTKFTDREDKAGLFHSENMINQIISDQLELGFKFNQIFLSGFSQGGAMALFVGLRAKNALAGIVNLSGYLPLSVECDSSNLHINTPVFIAGGRSDTVVLPDWTKYSGDWLEKRGFNNIVQHEYSMEHSVCAEEIRDLSLWFTKNILAITKN